MEERAGPCRVRGLPSPTGRPDPGPGTGLFLRGSVCGGVCSTHKASHQAPGQRFTFTGVRTPGASGGPSLPRVPRALGFPL